MYKSTQSEIRRENIRAVLSAVKKLGSAERSEITEETGISLMTVGKLVDSLRNAEILTQTKPQKESSGRRAGKLVFSDKFIIIVCKISPGKMSVSFINTSLEFVDTFVYPYNFSIEAEVNISSFFSKVRELLMEYISDKKLLGIGISLSGFYDEKNDCVPSFVGTPLEFFKPKEYMIKSFGFPPMAINSNIILSASIKDDVRSLLNIELDKNVLGGVFYYGKLVSGVGFSNFRSLKGLYGKELCDIVKKQDEEETAKALATAIEPICLSVFPNLIYVNLEDFSALDFEKNLKKELLELGVSTELIVEYNSKDAEIGTANLILNKWLDDNLS